MSILLILFCIATVVLLITRLHLHPFLALLVVSIVLGLLMGMPAAQIILSVQEGFGSTLGKIGLVIILGVLIGAFLENSGGAMVLAQRILKLVGKKKVGKAMGITGWIVSIPVFSDSGFVLLSSLNRNLTREAGLSLAGTAVALGLGLSVTHSLVPPTPGPIAAAGILGANLALVMGIGMLAALVALIAALIFARKVAAKVFIDPGPPTPMADAKHPPTLAKASFPIIVPIVLIVGKAIAGLWPNKTLWPPLKGFLDFAGEPVMALLIGFAFCLLLPHRLEKKQLSATGWVGKALVDSAGILLVTGAGGIFGKTLQNAGIADMLGQSLSHSHLGILLPFLLAATLKTAQGSSTVALITTASVVAPMMPELGLIREMHKALTVVSIGAGALVVSHVNDSFFWVVTQMSGMNVKQGYRLHTLGTLVIGCSAMLVVVALYHFL